MSLLRLAWCAMRGHGKLDQRLWGNDRHTMLCLRCGALLDRKGPGGPMPPGIARRSDTTPADQQSEGQR